MNIGFPSIRQRSILLSHISKIKRDFRSRYSIYAMPTKRPFSTTEPTSSPKKRTKVESPKSQSPVSLNEPEEYPNWPAPRQSIEAARNFILTCSKSTKPTLLVPDRDCDGLSSGNILRQTLIALGKPKDKIGVHFVGKGDNVHSVKERRFLEGEKLEGEGYDSIIVLDQGSGSGEVIAEGVSTLIIDHHYSKQFPKDAIICSACESPPIATSSLLTYIICDGLLKTAEYSDELKHTLTWLALIGIYGDMGPISLKEPPYPPILDQVTKSYKTPLTKLMSLLNAPRRTPSADPTAAWELLRTSSDASPAIDPKQIMALTSDTPPTDPILIELRKLLLQLDKAREATSAETEKCSHVPPIFTEDGRFAILTINSPYQIHPLIATRWSGHLKSSKLLAVGCANTGYLEGKVNFSCRLAKRSIKARAEVMEKKTGKVRKSANDAFTQASIAAGKVEDDSGNETDEEGKDDENIIAMLRGYAAEDEGFNMRLREAEAKGEVSFAKGHKEASGGSLTTELWEMFTERCLKLIKRDKKDPTTPSKGKNTKAADVAAKNGNTLDRYFGKPKKTT